MCDLNSVWKFLMYIIVLVWYAYMYAASFPLSREHFGNDVMSVEEGKKENRSAFARFLSMADFLDVSSSCMRGSWTKYTHRITSCTVSFSFILHHSLSYSVYMVSKCQLSALLLEGKCTIKRQLYSKPFILWEDLSALMVRTSTY